MGIRNNVWLKWQFDNAVLLFGTYIENKLNERDKEGKPKHKLETLLGLPRQRKSFHPEAYQGVLNFEIVEG